MNTQRIKKQTFWEDIQNILDDLNRKPESNDVILDFGCGKGELVELIVRQGFQCTMGVDIDIKRIDYARKYRSLGESQRFRVITKEPYRLPIKDNSIDFILSCQVLEHVKDIDACFREFARIMHPNSISIHIFPPKFRLFETHTNVPIGNIIKKFWWHCLWVSVGFRQQSAKKMSILECANAHIKYLQDNTFYRTEKEIKRAALRNDLNAYFLTGLKYSKFFGRIKNIHSFSPADIAYKTFVSKTLLLQPSAKNNNLNTEKNNSTIYKI